MKKEKFEGFCMSCGSVNLKIVAIPGKVGTGQFLQNQCRCADCGFEGIVLQGTRGFIKKFRKKLEAKK